MKWILSLLKFDVILMDFVTFSKAMRVAVYKSSYCFTPSTTGILDTSHMYIVISHCDCISHTGHIVLFCCTCSTIFTHFSHGFFHLYTDFQMYFVYFGHVYFVRYIFLLISFLSCGLFFPSFGQSFNE